MKYIKAFPSTSIMNPVFEELVKSGAVEIWDKNEKSSQNDIIVIDLKSLTPEELISHIHDINATLFQVNLLLLLDPNPNQKKFFPKYLGGTIMLTE